MIGGYQMEKVEFYTLEELKEAKRNNHELVTDLARKINDLKGYEVGYGNPGKGKIIINKDGMNYLVDIEPIGVGSLTEKMKSYNYIFK